MIPCRAYIGPIAKILRKLSLSPDLYIAVIKETDLDIITKYSGPRRTLTRGMDKLTANFTGLHVGLYIGQLTLYSL